MARSRTDKGGYSNPDVRYERKDIAPSAVLSFGIVFALLSLVSLVGMLWLGKKLRESERAAKVTQLPEAQVDKEWKQPPVHLEAIDDLQNKNVKLFPPRAEEYVRKQQQVLNKEYKIAQTMEELPSLLKARPTPAPTEFSIRLPSKAASGRVETGGQ